MNLAEITDLIKVGLFLVACVVSTQAVFILAVHLASMVFYPAFSDTPVVYFSCLCVLYCFASVANIKLLSNIRYVLLFIAALHLTEAVDYYLFEYTTLFARWYPWLIHFADFLILFFLLGKGGRDFAILKCARHFLDYRHSSVNNYIHQHKAVLYLLKIPKEQDKE